MSRLFHRSLLWGDFLEILSFLTINDVYRCCGTLNRAGFVAFLRERATRQCPKESASKSRFLSSGLNHQKILLVSYPRSGNSYLRRLLESSFGIVTGSDSRPNRTLSESLLKCGFKGEGVVDDSVWMVKTHYPERMGYLKFKARRIVLLVRNPFDAIESYFHMGMTNTHDKHLSPQAFKSVSHIWPLFVANEIAVWVRFHEFWMAVSQHIPVLPLRYEDLILNKQETLQKISNFMMEGPCPQGIKRFKPTKMTCEVDEGVGGIGVGGGGGEPGYKPKGGGLGKGIKLLDEASMDNIIAKSEFLLEVFGYKISTVSKTVRTQVFMETYSGREEAVGRSAGSTSWKISATNSSVGVDSRMHKNNAMTSVSEDRHSMEELKREIEVCSSIPSSSARRLDVSPVMEGGPEVWAVEFKRLSEARSRCSGRHKTESLSPKKENECFVNGECTAMACKIAPAHSPLIPGLDTKTDPIPSILINESFSVRLHSDLYGRRLTEIRRLYTDDDHNPLEVV